MDIKIYTELLQKAYRAEQDGDPYTSSGDVGLCDEELKYLEHAGYIEIVKQYVHGALYRITDKGLEKLSR